jgi:hypothetical protein
VLPEIALLIATTAIGLWAGGRWIDPMGDPGLNWSLGYRIASGDRLYRDIYLGYGPLSPYLLGAWSRLFGVSSASNLLLNWIPAIAAALLLLRTTRQLLSPLERMTLAAMIMATSLFVPGAGRLVRPYYPGVVHAFLFALSALLLVAWRPSRARVPLLAGALAGLAFCCKQEIGCAAVVALVLAAFAGNERPVPWASAAIVGFAGVAVAAVAFALWSAPLASLRLRDHFWPLAPRPPREFDTLFRYVSGLSDPHWFLEMRYSAWRLLLSLALLAALGGLLAREATRRAWRRVGWLVAALSVWWLIEGFSISDPPTPLRLSVVVSGVVGLGAFFLPGLAARPLTVALGLFAAMAGSRALVSGYEAGSYDGPAHFAAAASWAIFLFVFAPRILWASSPRSAGRMRIATAAALCVASAWLVVEGAERLRFPGRSTVETPVGHVYLDAEEAAMFREIGRRVRKGESVLVVPDINAVDVLYGLRSPSFFLDHLPGWLGPEVEADLIARLEKDPPSRVIFFERSTNEFGVAPFGRGFGVALWDWCFRNYRVVWSSRKGLILEPPAAPATATTEPPTYSPNNRPTS